MPLLGIDYGTTKVGLALADGMVATPLRVIRAASAKPRRFGRDPDMESSGLQTASWRRQLREEIRRACTEYDTRTIVVGIPRPLRGGTSAQTKAVEEFVAWLRRELSIPVLTEDERLTTAFAKRLMREWEGKADDDAIAAALILQSYIERTS